MVIKGWREKGSQIYGDGRGLDFGCEHTIEYAGDILQNHIPETYIMLLTDITPINLI